MADDTLQPDPGSIVRIFKEGTLHTDPPLTIRQGDILQRLSKLSTETVSRDHFLKALPLVIEEEVSLADLFVAFGVIATPEELDHVRTHWFSNDQNQAYWPEQPARHVEEEMARGLQDAFQKAKETNWPVECYWMIY